MFLVVSTQFAQGKTILHINVVKTDSPCEEYTRSQPHILRYYASWVSNNTDNRWLFHVNKNNSAVIAGWNHHPDAVQTHSHISRGMTVLAQSVSSDNYAWALVDQSTLVLMALCAC